MSVNDDNQEDFPIYRIMSIYEFYELYVNHRLKLTLFALQKDKNDGIEHLLKDFIFNTIGYVEKENIPKKLETIRNNNYMTCWTQNPESIAMWSLYSPNKEAIRVKTTKQKLRNCLLKFIWNNECHSQWDRPLQRLVTKSNHIRDHIQRAKYEDTRKLVEEIKKDLLSLIEKSKSITNTEILEHINKIEDKYSFLDENFIKDESYSYEQEIRGRVETGINILEQYETYDEWEKTNPYNKLPIKNNKRVQAEDKIQYANTEPNFIDEICFDPRMPSYKKNSIIDMIKIDQTKIAESKCFSPAIDTEFNLF